MMEILVKGPCGHGGKLWPSLLLLLPLLLLGAGCGRDDVKVYQTAKQTDQSSSQTATALPPGHPEVSSAPGMPPTAVPGSGSPLLTWKTPDSWTEQAPSAMRMGSFKVTNAAGKSADISIIPLGGIAGGDAANVNRWRGQVGLEPISADEIKLLAQSVEVAGQPAELYDLSGKSPATGEPEGILVAIAQRGNVSWFFKMTGDPGVIAEQKPVFQEFLGSVKFESGDMAAAPSGMPPMGGMSLPAGHPDVSGMGAMAAMPPAASAPPAGGEPEWQVPAGWQEVPGGQFLVAKFNVSGEDGAQAAVNVSTSAGDGGGLVANVNRWRKQLGLAEQTDAEISQTVATLDVPGGKATVVEISGLDARTGRPTKVFGALVPVGGQTWFYKLMGDAKVVDAQKNAFTKFVQTVKY